MLTMGAIAFAATVLIFMLSWQFGNRRIMIDTLVRLRSGHLQVQANGYRENQDIRAVVPDPLSIECLLEKMKGIQAYTLRARSVCMVSSQDRTCSAAAVGVETRESSVSVLPNTVRRGAYFSAGDSNVVLVGDLLAQSLKLEQGDELTILGQGYDGSVAASVLKVKGIFSSGEDEFDRTCIFVPLPYFQELFFMGETVHEIVIRSTSLNRVPQIKNALTAAIQALPAGSDLVVLDWQELAPGLMQSIKVNFIYGFVFYTVLIVIVAFSILNTFLMTIFERTKEFGVILAVGCRPGRLTNLILLESTIMIFLGLLAGILFGSLVTWYYQVHGILMPGALELAHMYGFPERMVPELSLRSMATGSGIVCLVSLVTAIYPTFRVRRLKVIQAINAG